jgi:hypothetical protein
LQSPLDNHMTAAHKDLVCLQRRIRVEFAGSPVKESAS